MSDLLLWLAVLFCLSQSAMLSGLNLAVFGIGRLHLEAMAETDDPEATTAVAFREDANLTLVTTRWGNVGVNVLLTLLVDRFSPVPLPSPSRPSGRPGGDPLVS